MFTNRSVVTLENPKGAFMLNLHHFKGGADTALQFIPESTSGTYCWFRTYNYPSETDAFCDALIRDLESTKFQSRSGSIKPYYNVTISSKGWVAESKVSRLKAALVDPVFKDGLLSAFSSAPLFQAPLYVGKSLNLRKRIGQHLKSESPLRLRLSDAGIRIDESSILIVPNPTSNTTETITNEFDSEIEEENEYELLYEEIFSRLFCPLFTIRLG